ncbi:Mitochondrial carnitine-acylcarnitine carrier protein [Phaffia rhodozyma]|uniref:Mitochondrial carnitine-acylcarnitine carrier protein n=1 Tax=Phaffia rhodozyma TaxID=264483 RepID=A0A0F7SNE4_PHARH|nr:Mitochondrial carnitine-acylcarnitine carrier protein [Phaffia rhodozyma]
MTEVAIPEGSQSQQLKDLAFGSVAGSCAKVFEHPFDLCKVRLQSQPPDSALRYTGPLDCFKQTWSKEGIRGLYRGLSAPVVGASVENATLFLVYNQIQKAITSFKGDTGSANAPEVASIGELAIAAAGAGFIASFVLTPIELIKVKMQVTLLSREGLLSSSSSVQPGKKPDFSRLPGPWTIIKQTYAQTGLRGFWLGQSGTLLRETGGSSAWFSAFEIVSRAFMRLRESQQGLPKGSVTKKDLKAWELCVSGGAAGMAYNIVLFPADTVKSALQTAAELRPDLTRQPSFMGTAKEIYKARGLRGLYAGCGITVARAAPSSALIFLIYESLNNHYA